MTYVGSDALASPVVAWNPGLGKTAVYLATTSGYLEAYDQSDGVPLWSVELGPVHATPLAEGRYVWVAPLSGGRLYKLDAATGATVCSAGVTDGAGESIDASPTIATPPGGRPTIYIGANDSSTQSGPLTAVNEADCSVDFRVTSVPSSSGTSGIWDFISYGVSATGEGLVLYGTADPDASVYANDALTGQLVWRYAVNQPAGDYDVGAGVTVSPPGQDGFVDGVAYVESKYSILNAIDLTTGTLIWSKPLETAALATPALSGNNLVVGTESDGVYDFNPATGKVRWHFADPAGLDASPALVGPAASRVVVFGDFAGAVDVLSLRSGSLLYTYKTAGYIVTSPAEANGSIIQSSGDGFLYDLTPGGSNAAAPTTAVTAPADQSTVTNPDGDLSVTGTASAPTGVDQVTVAIRSSAGMWWDSSTGTWTPGAYPNPATLASPGASSSTWEAGFPVPAAGGSFEVFASAVSQGVADPSAGGSTPTRSRSSFTVGPSSSQPALSLSASWVAPGGIVDLSGSGFAPSEQVRVTFDSTQIALVTATSSGQLAPAPVKIPPGARFGPAGISASGQTSALSSTASVYVTNSWSQFGGLSTLAANDPNDNVFRDHVGVNSQAYLDLCWSFTAGAPVPGSVDVADGTAYFVDESGTVYAVSMASATPVWVQSLPGNPTVTSTPALTPTGQVVVATGSGTVVALQASNGTTAWETTLSGTLTSPTVANGMIYVGSSDGTLTAIAATSGAIMWSAHLGGGVTSAPAVDPSADLVVVGDGTGTVSAFDSANGAYKWSASAGGAINGSPVIGGGSVYVGSTAGSVYALGEATGSHTWSFATGASVVSSPALVNGDVVVGSTNANVYWLSASNGTEQYQVAQPGAVVGVAGAGDFAAVTDSDGSITGSKPSTDNADAWTATQGASLSAAPTVVNGEVIVAGQDSMVNVYTVPGSPAF